MADTNKINVVVKTSSGAKYDISTEKDITVEEFKKLLEQQSQIPAEQQRLIYSGHVLRNEQKLSDFDIKDGHTMHLVRSARAAPTQPAPSTASPGTSTTGYTSSGHGTGFEGVGGLGSGGANANNNMNPFAMLNNPEMLQNIMNNPMVTALLSDPNIVREMLLSNPRMRQLVDRNPELNHVLNNPEVMRQTIEMMRNPELMREMTRNTDRQLANIETHPEGFNLLSRLYHDLQDPLYDSMTQSGQQESNSNSAPIVDAQRNERNTNPLPNPWSSGGQGTQSAPNTTAPGANTAQPNPFANLFGSMNTGQAQPGGAQPNPFANLMGGFGGMPGGMSGGMPGGMPGGMGGMPPMDFNTIAQMMQNPFVQNMMQQMMSNPALLQQMLANNPFAQQMMNSNPMMRDMMSNPEVLRQLSDPSTMQNLAQMQQALGQLQGMGQQGGGLGFGQPAQPQTSQPQTGSAPQQPGANPAVNPFAQLFGGMGVPQMPQQPQQQQGPQDPPEVRFAVQLRQLNDMGFTNYEANIAALQATMGNVQLAIERLLGNM